MNKTELDAIMRSHVRFALSWGDWYPLFYKARMMAYGVADFRIDPALERESSRLWEAFMGEAMVAKWWASRPAGRPSPPETEGGTP